MSKEQREKDYQRGAKAAWSRMLGECLREVAGRSAAEAEPRVTIARLVKERADAIATLRMVCEEYGDNDWPDTLDLSDIIEKHLHRRLFEREPDAPADPEAAQ